MKKFTAIMMMVILVIMSLTVTAHGEVRVMQTGQELKDGEYVYYVVLGSESGNSAKLYVTEDEWYSYLKEEFNRKEAERREQNPTWFEKTVDTIAFWK